MDKNILETTNVDLESRLKQSQNKESELNVELKNMKKSIKMLKLWFF